MRFSVALLPFVLASALHGQTPSTPPLPQPQPVPSDRLDDSYTIYSQLMPGREFASWKADQWLLVGVTVLPLGPQVPCPAPDAPEEVRQASLAKALAGDWNNPRKDIKPPPNRKADLDRVLADFDRRFCERLQLGHALRVDKPYQVLSEDEKSEFTKHRFSGKPTDATGLAAYEAAEKRYKGAPGLNSFSEVYFNPEHTLAMVYAMQWCGGLCAQGYWVVLERVDGKWVERPWVNSSWVS